MTEPRLGPVLSATIVTRDIDHSIVAYTQHLGQRVLDESRLTPARARTLGWPDLAGNRVAWLGNELDEPWLCLLEFPDAEHLQPFSHYGWLSLEIAVQDVDSLGTALESGPFEVIGVPANLAMSDAIKAMQLLGPSGEVLYLTQVKRPVPPFDLPTARCAVDRLFIPVMLCPDRRTALGRYEALSGNAGMTFDTCITVLNRARGWPVDRQHPVATLQLAGANLIELDEVPDLAPAPHTAARPPTGIAMVQFEHPDHAPGLATGAAGERIEIINPKRGLPQ